MAVVVVVQWSAKLGKAINTVYRILCCIQRSLIWLGVGGSQLSSLRRPCSQFEARVTRAVLLLMRVSGFSNCQPEKPICEKHQKLNDTNDTTEPDMLHYGTWQERYEKDHFGTRETV